MGNAWSHVTGIIDRITRTNALYPLLIAFVLSVVLAVSVMPFTDSAIIEAIAFFPVLLISWQIISAFTYFMRNNPEMLRTETHVRQMRALELFGDKDNPLHVEADHVVQLITDPSLPVLPPPGNNHD